MRPGESPAPLAGTTMAWPGMGAGAMNRKGPGAFLALGTARARARRALRSPHSACAHPRAGRN